MTESALSAGLAGLWRRTVHGFYHGCLRNARIVQLAILVACAVSLAFVGRFSFDASSDSLVAQGDPELAYFEGVVERFGEGEALFLTYTPRDGTLFSPTHLEVLASLQQELEQVPGVRHVTSLLDVPLLRSPPVALSELAEGYKTIREGADPALARAELVASPLFRDLLVSADGTTTALQVELEANAQLIAAKKTLDSLRAGEEIEGPGADTNEAADRYRTLKTAHQEQRAALLSQVRDIRTAYEDMARLYLGGVPMVSADIIDFVRRDMRLLSGAVVLLMAAALYAFFGRWRWVMIPMGTVSVTVLIMLGLLGLLDRPATAVSSNFIPLLAITTISFTIHLIARYRELCITGFSDNHVALVYETMRSKLAPCLYTGLTTAVAFASLMVSDIRPVAEFGFIMVLGIAVGLTVTYSFFAGVLVMMPYSKKAKPHAQSSPLTRWFSHVATARPGAILVGAVVLAVSSWVGITQLSVNNRFVDYFRSGSEIRDGMVFIDERLGGTIPFDIVLQFPPWEPQETDEDDDFAFDDAEPDPYPERYWFTPARLSLLERLEDYLGERTEVGKVVSISTLEHIARAFNDDKPLDYLQITAVLALVPDEIKESLIHPYASPSTGELRLSARIHETGPKFSQDELFADIEQFATQELGLAQEQVHVTGMAVLFNDMLKRLFSSQQSTLLAVLAAILLTFALLLRSLRLAVLGILPTALAAECVLAVMGIAGIPLDIMTITTAAIIVGIGVDDAIHYLHRFREERALGHDTLTAVRNSHASIGNALYFTSITVVVGFSVLVLSSFVPTIYFGVLTALAMVLALAANLVVLPALLIKFYR